MNARRDVTRTLRPYGLDLRSTLGSRRRGRIDASRLRVTVADVSPDAAELITPYVQEVRLIAELAANDLRGRLLRDRHALVAGIHSGAVAVITQYEVRRSQSPALLDRWGRSVAEWRTAAAHCRNRAETVTGYANLRLAHYWDAVWHRQSARDRTARTRPPAWLPGTVTLDAGWQDPDAWLAATPGADSALVAALRVLDAGHTAGPRRTAA
ncbi:hypothetical protein [Streptomyces sp. NPDC056785]|uniref:hypothetical protein n=1 Tax=Streptomyces sp. NPDC056785 TaxID=3345944 RepID=UPI0036B6842D